MLLLLLIGLAVLAFGLIDLKDTNDLKHLIIVIIPNFFINMFNSIFKSGKALIDKKPQTNNIEKPTEITKKDEVNIDVPLEDPNKKSQLYRTYRIENHNVDDHDIEQVNNITEEECRKQCHNNDKCRWYGYNVDNKTCQLKGFINDLDYMTGMKSPNKMHWYDNSRIESHEISKFDTNSINTCGTTCMSDPNCLAKQGII